MSNYSKYIRQYLLKNESVSLEKIGIFSIRTHSSGTETSFIAPQDIHYVFDRKAPTSEELINYLSEKEQKPRSLVDINLDAYLHQLRQFINTGKTVAIEGLGFLEMNRSGEYEFKPQDKIVKSLPDEPSVKRYKKEEAPVKRYVRSADQMTTKHSSNQIPVAVKIIISLIVLAGIGFGIYYLISNKKLYEESNVNTVDSVAADTMAANVAPVQKTDTAAFTGKKQTSSDSASYKFIFETTASADRAHSRVAKLKEYGDPAQFDSLQSDTGFVYSLYIQKKILPADTTRIRDSLQKYFQRNITIK